MAPECLHGHSPWKRRLGTRPTRVIHVQSDGKTAQVADAATVPEDEFRYLTLSHSWGTVKFPTLTMANFDSFQQHILIEHADFNQTFREAIAVTALLGYSYIRIDSLCILQGSPGGADWAAECPRMSIVYSGSDLNLSASGFSNPQRGMMAMSRAALVPPLLELADGAMARVVLQNEHGGDWPLEKRGWVLQENLLLSSRAFLQCSYQYLVLVTTYIITSH
jgi:hypothetical protein